MEKKLINIYSWLCWANIFVSVILVVSGKDTSWLRLYCISSSAVIIYLLHFKQSEK